MVPWKGNVYPFCPMVDQREGKGPGAAVLAKPPYQLVLFFQRYLQLG